HRTPHGARGARAWAGDHTTLLPGTDCPPVPPPAGGRRWRAWGCVKNLPLSALPGGESVESPVAAAVSGWYAAEPGEEAAGQAAAPSVLEALLQHRGRGTSCSAPHHGHTLGDGGQPCSICSFRAVASSPRPESATGTWELSARRLRLCRFRACSLLRRPR